MFSRLTSSAVAVLVICSCLVVSCSRRKTAAERTERDGVRLGQDVTNDPKPKDVIFVNFERNWRKFINPSPELALPVVAVRNETKKAYWQPIVQSDCVFSADAGGNVPQVSLTWNEPTPQTGATQQLETSEHAKLRFDLALHYQGFERNYFSSALSTDKLKRFNLPSNSELIANSDALLVTGPGLFPMLVNFGTEMVKGRDVGGEIPRQTLVIRDLAPGLAYTLRMATLGNDQWNEGKRFAFSTPVCPKEF